VPLSRYIPVQAKQVLDLEEGTVEKDAMGQGQHFEHDSRIESVLPGQGFQESKLFVPVVMQ